MGKTRNKAYDLDISGYNCRVTALSLGEFLSLSEGASTLNAQIVDDVLEAHLVSPKELKDLIREGNLPYGIPLLLFEGIIEVSGFNLRSEDRNAYLANAREKISTSVVDSCRAMILASGIASLAELEDYTMFELLDTVAIAENVLNVRQQNHLGALSGGSPLQLIWDAPSSPIEEDAVQKMQSKQSEVEAILQETTTMRLGRGMRKF